MPVSDVDPLDKNRGDIASPVLDRLANEIHIAGFCRVSSRPVKDNFHVFSDKRFSRCEGAIEQFNEALLLNLRNGLASGQADHIAMPDQLLIGGIRQAAAMF